MRFSLVFNLDNFDSELKHFKQICPKEMLDKLSNPLTLKNKLSKTVFNRLTHFFLSAHLIMNESGHIA